MELEVSSTSAFNAEHTEPRGKPATARVAQTLRVLKDLVLWHSADSEGRRAFHVQNKGREWAFLSVVLGSVH